MAASEREELAGIAADLRAHIEWLRESGVREVPKPALAPHTEERAQVAAEAPASQVSLRAAVRAAVAPPPPAPQPSPMGRGRPGLPESTGAQSTGSTVLAGASVHRPLPAGSGRGEGRTLEQIRAEMGNCTRCNLAAKRKNIVYGVGSAKAELVFVGEGPGAEEDEQGIPFVGAAGQLLTKMIQAMGFSRDDVYICNVVKCRPPGNRNPEPDEITACEPFLKAQLESLKPKVIVTLGKFAAQTLLRESTAITRMRGKWREYCGIRLMPTFHPAYLLRQPSEKKLVWEDLQQVMKVFGKEPKR